MALAVPQTHPEGCDFEVTGKESTHGAKAMIGNLLPCCNTLKDKNGPHDEAGRGQFSKNSGIFYASVTCACSDDERPLLHRAECTRKGQDHLSTKRSLCGG